MARGDSRCPVRLGGRAGGNGCGGRLRRRQCTRRGVAPAATARLSAYDAARPGRCGRSRRGLREHDAAGRSLHRRRGIAPSSRTRAGARRAARPRWRGTRARRDRHGQAGRRRAQRLVGHRSRLRVSLRRQHGWRPRSRQPRVLRPSRPSGHRGAARGHRGGLRIPRRHAAAALWRERTAERSVRGARGVPDHAGTDVGALCVAEGTPAHRSAPCRTRRVDHAVRLSQVPRFRRVRRVARRPPADQDARQAARLRARRQARPRRDPRNRVHHASAAARARRTRACAAFARDAGGPRRARRPRHPARQRCRRPAADLSFPAQCRASAPVPGRSADPEAACRCRRARSTRARGWIPLRRRLRDRANGAAQWRDHAVRRTLRRRERQIAARHLSRDVRWRRSRVARRPLARGPRRGDGERNAFHARVRRARTAR